MKQTTFMMLKPDAFESHQVANILQDMQAAGLIIESAQEWVVDETILQVLEKHYAIQIAQMDPSFHFQEKLRNSFHPSLAKKIKPMKVSFVGESDIIEVTRSLIGATNPQVAAPKSIRNTYSNDSYERATSENRLLNNVIHAADSHASAQRELQLWSAYIN